MAIVAWIPILSAVASGVAYCLLGKAPNLKQLSGWLFLASAIAFEMSLAGHVAQIAVRP